MHAELVRLKCNELEVSGDSPALLGDFQGRQVPRLYGAPKILPNEAPSSWAARVAASNNITTAHLMALWGIVGQVHVLDLLGHDAPIESIAATTLRSLGEVTASFHQCAQIPLELRSALTTRFGSRSPANRFCPRCLAEDATPYLRFNWRMNFSYVCPTHDVILLQRCPECDTPMTCDSNPDHSPVGNRTRQTIGHCCKCRTDLSCASTQSGSELRRFQLRRFQQLIPAIVEGSSNLDPIGKHQLIRALGKRRFVFHLHHCIWLLDDPLLHQRREWCEFFREAPPQDELNYEQTTIALAAEDHYRMLCRQFGHPVREFGPGNLRETPKDGPLTLIRGQPWPFPVRRGQSGWPSKHSSRRLLRKITF